MISRACSGRWNTGDMTVGIPTPERNRSAVVAIRETHAIWEPMDASAIALLKGGDPHDHAMAIAGANQTLLEKTELLASIIVNEYADPFEVLLTDALAIPLAGRPACWVRGGGDGTMPLPFVSIRRSDLGRSVYLALT